MRRRKENFKYHDSKVVGDTNISNIAQGVIFIKGIDDRHSVSEKMTSLTSLKYIDTKHGK